MYVLVLSLGDPVSRTFLNLLPETPLVETRGDVEIRKLRDLPLVIHRGEPTDFDREDILAPLGRYALFISRHEMTNPKPIFTVHTPGTWPDVSVSNPHLVSAVFRTLCKYVYEPFTCAFEATHHPPNTSAVSATFVEVGSTESEWTDRKAVDVLLRSVEEALGGGLPENPPAMVVGDLHYVTVADMALRGEVDLGHVVPKYVEITLEAVRTAYRKHTAPVKKAVVFRKNVKNPTRGEVVEFLRSQGVEVVLKG
ncbi:MAG: D-tyrosyl-tRNA(Tyr) deacylase [Pyrobaculum sp.]|nr:D-tyrosyl-tRNA(Tyr) deacylase [Pyrobaculum sp.]